MGTAYGVTTSTNNVYLFTAAGTLSSSNPNGSSSAASGLIVVTDASGVAALNDSSGNAQLTVTSLGNGSFSLTNTSANPVTIAFTKAASPQGNPQVVSPGTVFTTPQSGTITWQPQWGETGYFEITLAVSAVLTNIPKLPAGLSYVPVGGVLGIRG